MLFSSDEEFDGEVETEELMMSSLSEGAKLIPSAHGSTTKSVNSTMPAYIETSRDSEDNQGTEYPYHSSPLPCESGELPGPLKSTLYVWLLSAFAAIGGFLFGYDTGVVSGAMLLLRKEFSLSSFWQELIVSVTIAAAFLSSLLGGHLNDRFGRKIVTILSSFIFTVGAAILGFAQNVAMLVIGRLILGIGIGFASMTVPVYIAESAPTHLRGQLVTVNTLFITGGQFIASLMDGGFSYVKPDGWRYMLGLAGLPSLIQFCGFFFLPESPRWLVRKGRDADARAVLIKLRGSELVGEELDEIKQSISADSQKVDGPVLLQIWRTPPVRRAIIVGCGLQFFQQLSGINTVMYYSATIIKMSGVSDEHKAIWLAALTAGINFSFTLMGLWLVDRLGRRKLILGSLSGVCLSLTVLAIAFQLAAVHSPPVGLKPDPLHLNSTCSSYRWCESCIEDKHCGFCYSDSSGSVNGSCLATDPEDDVHANYGQCENETLPHGVTWAYDFCPTPYSWMAVLGLVLYLLFFAPGMGPMPWTINSEIYPLWARSTGNSLSAATNWLSNLLVSMTFLTLTEELTKYGTYWLFVGIALLGLVFITVCLPETKGRKLEDIQELFIHPWNCCCRARPSEYKSLDTQEAS